MQIINGREISKKIREELKERTKKIIEEKSKIPSLATILVGENPASKVYISSKIKACEEIGIKSSHHNLPATATQEEIISLIEKLNNDKNISGILLQLPLPNGQNAEKCINAISPDKDVDGLHPYNAGMLTLVKSWQEILNQKLLVSCTPMGVIYLLKYSNIDIKGKNVVVIGRSNLVGKPVSMLMLANDATVTMAHSATQNLKDITKKADIVIAAIGKTKFVNKDFIKEGATIIDVGINRCEDKLCGDVDFESVKDMEINITPVPGGVGPMTITMLLHNTILAFERQ
ncbi:MAG: bifunctional methylenetetrahydrofolate dehydrogenase/methenyltetrahydrofolate cyclohydrolase FolD [Endomicrobiia bacterium]|nr:bifunctional methylenetetrahydrofolate dehydrogenase/methenyltetrahydrofolate cyclohydrolase FolD [Endomicrobiaceae bacterium]MDD3053675.1 bifunctional methylenetetrahydrofolate dehydrogenase/methenyltetrahydrofolate cyclohydrolase FolD [Endomicrobiaceae bacterium]MDD3922813.1 bifunctional methylenetetrahydrofolate dehydrogenase/methenyltetrahydrofolate cyclohydrolase FolD [Endomicrobiaceae bacterium]MDD5102535.1 bifunctional methylenetetrahydrofolate dehydrogenase/methenyltetrahydrofolate cy